MNILFDTNIILDVMLDRKLFSYHSSLLLTKVEKGKISGFLCATTITTIHYIASKAVGNKKAKLEIEKLFNLFEIAPVNRTVLKEAANNNFTDFEDAVIYEVCRYYGVNAIVSRDIKGFKRSNIKVYSPKELAEVLEI